MRELLLFLSTPLLTYIFAIVFFVIWSRDTKRRENLALSAGWAVLGTGFMISLFSPDHWGRAIVAITHVPYTLSAVLVSWGLLRRIGVRPPMYAQLWVAAAGFGVMMFVQSFGNAIIADLLITNLTCGVMFVMTAQLYANAAKRDLVERAIFVMIALTAAQFFVRPVTTLMFDDAVAAESYRDTVYYLALYWVFAFGSVLFGLTQVAGAVKDQVGALRNSTSTDSLSGLFMRGEFEQRVEAAIAKASRTSSEVALVIGDIDHFKQVNDIWGHPVGDSAIAGFGEMIARTIRATDVAGRVGGEEFCILVSDADENVAAGLAERLRYRASNLDVSKGALDVRLTASFGVAELSGSESYRSLFARADAALYEAKNTGRNRVVRASKLTVEIASPTPTSTTSERAA